MSVISHENKKFALEKLQSFIDQDQIFDSGFTKYDTIPDIFTGIYDADKEIIMRITDVSELINLYQTHEYLQRILNDREVLNDLTNHYNLSNVHTFQQFVIAHDKNYFSLRCDKYHSLHECAEMAARAGHINIAIKYVEEILSMLRWRNNQRVSAMIADNYDFHLLSFAQFNRRQQKNIDISDTRNNFLKQAQSAIWKRDEKELYTYIGYLLRTDPPINNSNDRRNLFEMSGWPYIILDTANKQRWLERETNDIYQNLDNFLWLEKIWVDRSSIKNYESDSWVSLIVSAVAETGNILAYREIVNYFQQLFIPIDWRYVLRGAILSEYMDIFDDVFKKCIDYFHKIPSKRWFKNLELVENVNVFEKILSYKPSVRDTLDARTPAILAHWNVMYKILSWKKLDNDEGEDLLSYVIENIYKSPEPEHIFVFIDGFLSHYNIDVTRFIASNVKYMSVTLFFGLIKRYPQLMIYIHKDEDIMYDISHDLLAVGFASDQEDIFQKIQDIFPEIKIDYVTLAQILIDKNKVVALKRLLKRYSNIIDYNKLLTYTLRQPFGDYKIVNHLIEIIKYSPEDYLWNFSDLADASVKRYSPFCLDIILTLADGISDTDYPVDFDQLIKEADMPIYLYKEIYKYANPYMMTRSEYLRELIATQQ
jgi:hypothetical protein